MTDDRPPRPDTLEFDPSAVPDDLRDREQWVAWRHQFDDDRDEWTKVPVDVGSSGFASSTDPDTWTSFSLAAAFHDRGDTNTDGVGFVVHEEDLFVGLDLDDCRDPETGDLEAWAEDLLEDVPTYAEISPSSTGLRLFGFGFVPDGGTRSDVDGADGHLEMYETGRYLTVTGHAIDDAPEEVRQVNDEIADVHAEYIAGDDPDDGPDVDLPKPTGDGGVQAQTPDANPGFDAPGPSSTDGGSDLTDDELLEKAKNAENGDKFASLWIGDTAGYDSHSEADLALCGLLAFWTGGDRRRIDDLFRQSNLYRDKWDADRGAQTYGERTIEKALEGRTEFYDPDGDASPTDRNLELGSDTETDSDVEFSPREMVALAGVESLTELNDREKSYFVTHQIALSDEAHVLAAQPDGTIYRYDDGIWTETGEQLLREIGNRALQAAYGSNTHTELCERIRATRPVPREELGSPAGTIAVENGLLELDSRGLQELQPDDYALTRIPVAYDPHAEAPRWEAFIDEVVEADRSAAIQEYVGYTLLVGELPIHRALMLVGEGSNGKSTFLRVVRELLGEDNITAHALQNLSQNEHNVADLYGTVANICADLSSDGIGDGGMFKTLVGGDTVTGRRLYQEPFSFEATAKQLYSANQVPDVDIDDEAFFRRWLVVEFPTQFTDPDKPGPDKDPDLTDELIEELPGILNWALDGLKRLTEQGHFTGEGDPLEKRDRWMSWGDSISQFIDECVDTDADGRWRTGDVYARYAAWCREELGEEPEAQQTLTKELKACQGVAYGHYRFDGKKDRGFKGFDIADDVPPAHDEPGADAAAVDGAQTSLSQGRAIETIVETVRDLEADREGPVPIDEVVDAVAMDDDRAHTYLDKLLTDGQLYQPETGRVATP